MYDSSHPKNWGLTLDYYKKGNWGSFNNGKFKIPISMKKAFTDENNVFDEEKFYNNMIMTFINAFMFLKRDIFNLIRPSNLATEDLELARRIINIAFEESMINNNLYQITKAQTFESGMGNVASQQTAWNDQLDLFGERSKSLIGTWGKDYIIYEVEIEDGSNIDDKLRDYFFKNSNGILEPISKLKEENFPERGQND